LDSLSSTKTNHKAPGSCQNDLWIQFQPHQTLCSAQRNRLKPLLWPVCSSWLKTSHFQTEKMKYQHEMKTFSLQKGSGSKKAAGLPREAPAHFQRTGAGTLRCTALCPFSGENIAAPCWEPDGTPWAHPSSSVEELCESRKRRIQVQPEACLPFLL